MQLTLQHMTFPNSAYTVQLCLRLLTQNGALPQAASFEGVSAMSCRGVPQNIELRLVRQLFEVEFQPRLQRLMDEELPLEALPHDKKTTKEASRAQYEARKAALHLWVVLDLVCSGFATQVRSQALPRPVCSSPAPEGRTSHVLQPCQPPWGCKCFNRSPCAHKQPRIAGRQEYMSQVHTALQA